MVDCEGKKTEEVFFTHAPGLGGGSSLPDRSLRHPFRRLVEGTRLQTPTELKEE